MKSEVISTAVQAKALIRTLQGLKEFAVDIETPSVDWRRDKTCALTFFNGGTVWIVVPWKVDVGLFKPILEDRAIIKVIHNSPFDCTWLAREFGIWVKGIYDTMHGEQILLGGRPNWNKLKVAERKALKPTWSAALEHCLTRRGWPVKLEFEPFEYGVPYTKHQVNYMAADVSQLLKLKADQEKRLEDLGLGNVLKLENKVVEVTIQLMVNGFGVDKEGWIAYGEENREVYESIQVKLREYKDINWQAPGQACKYFGVRLIAELEALGLDTQEYRLWRKGRDIYKNVTTYGVKWAQTHVMPDNRVRSDYNQIKNTGRYSSNLQQFPSKTLHRSFFIPNYFPGGSFIRADFKSQELAIMAVGAQEPTWLKVLRSGGDVHAVCAEMVLGTEWKRAKPELKKQLRGDVKEINFGIPYGMTIEGYCEKTGHSEERAVKLFRLHKSTFPILHRWLDRGGDFCQKHGVSYSFEPFRRLRVPGPWEPGWRLRNIGKNNPVQATGADMMKLAMVLLNNSLAEYFLQRGIFVLQLHDELVLEAAKEWTQWVKGVLAEAMTNACTRILGEPLSKPEISIAQNWSKI